MDAERLVKISRDNISAGRRFPGCPKRRWSNLISDLPTTKKKTHSGVVPRGLDGALHWGPQAQGVLGTLPTNYKLNY